MPNQNNNANPGPIFPQADLPPLPPSFQDVPPAGGSNGSAAPTETAPPNLPPVISGSPKKKFGGGRIIATILGILLLVGGVGAGFVLTQQQQLFSQKAAMAEPCNICTNNKCTKVASPPSCSSTLNECSNVGGSCGVAPPIPTSKPPDPTSPPSILCPRDCIAPKSNCAPGSFYPTESQSLGYGDCGAALGEYCCNSGVATPTPTPTGGGACQRLPSPNNLNATSFVITQEMANTCARTCPGAVLYANKYTCDSANPSGGCQDNGQSQSAAVGSTLSVGNVTCGTVQVDLGCKSSANTWGSVAFTSKSASQACSTSTTPGPGPLAQCLSVKAYNSTWTLLTGAQLSTLTPGTSVNFCVAGTTSSGSFDKAKFTINGVAQAETTTKRPSSDDYCQSYGVPTGVSSFNISAQIHHATLGWSL